MSDRRRVESRAAPMLLAPMDLRDKIQTMSEFWFFEFLFSLKFSDDASKKYEQQKGDMLAPGGGQLDGLDSRHIQKKPEMLYPVGLNLLEKVSHLWPLKYTKIL